ncbi:transposase [Niabella terrae]
MMQSITAKSDFEIEVFESDIDHIHFLIRYIPRLSVTSIVRKLKQESTIAIWQKHKTYCQRTFGKNMLSGQMVTLFALLEKQVLNYPAYSFTGLNFSCALHPQS